MRSDDNNLLVGRRKEGQMTIVLRGHMKVLCTLTSIEKALGTQLSRMLADETMSESFMVVYGVEVMNQ